jgi:diaminopimelate epimerase
MTRIKFYKMEGTGNDFVIIDNRETRFSLKKIISFTSKLCNRKFGIGADGLLVLETAQLKQVDYTMIYRNADGSDAGMCGNGSRCLALFAATHGFNTDQTFNVHDKIYKAEVDLQNSSVSVSFPNVDSPKRIKIEAKELIQVYTGTEHIVQFVDSEYLEKEEELVKVGSMIRYHKTLNPPGTNINFIYEKEDSILELQTYERGVENLTLACGTGAIASAISSHFYNALHSEYYEYTIHVKGGILKVSFSFNNEEDIYKDVKLKGLANHVFEGVIDV